MMRSSRFTLRTFLYGLLSMLLGFGIFFLANSYIKEIELIQNSARLELLERSFAFHPKLSGQALEDRRVLYVYILNSDGDIVEYYLQKQAVKPERVEFPADDLQFSRRSVGGTEVLQLDKLLRRGREEEGEKQGLILGLDYTVYQLHEYRAFGKYFLMLAGLLSLVSLFFVTWRKWQKAQAEMEENERFVYTGKLSRQIAHEIKNPLGVMQATIDYLKELNDPELIKEELTDISTEIQRLNRLVERIRSFARHEKPELALLMVEAFLQDFLARLVHRYPGLIGSFGEQGAVQKVLADSDQLTQVLLNLVQNADESYPPEVAPEERKILLGMRRNRRGVEIFVQDWGTPIAPEIRGRLFDAFVTTKTQGSGLGLAISRQIVQNHGGELTLHVEDGMKRFSLILPVN